MISIILPISTRQGLENFQRSIVNLEEGYSLGLDILLLVRGENLYLDARDWTTKNIDRGECLVEFGDGDPYAQARSLLWDKNEFVYVGDESYIIPRGGLVQLARDYVDLRTAGFISADYGEDKLWVEDIYSEDINLITKKVRGENIIEVDIVKPRGLLMRKEIFLMNMGKAWGITLRRQGYKNYLDKRVVLRNGG